MALEIVATPEGLTSAAMAVASAGAYLHDSQHTLHGDLYAHNINVKLSPHERVATVKLGDMGAATRYASLAQPLGAWLQAVEVRAFG